MSGALLGSALWLAMGNALSGGDAPWPVRRTSNAQFASMPDRDATTATATFGAGCYWGTEKWYAKDFARDWDAPEGAVIATSVGFMGPPGAIANPTYRQVCGGASGHVEVCQVKYDPRKCSYENLARHLFTFHDPTTPDRQGNDRGPQYASVIFAHDPEQRKSAEKVRGEVQKMLNEGEIRSYAGTRVTTAIEDATVYYPAHEAHQKYLQKKPQGYCNHVRRFRWPSTRK